MAHTWLSVRQAADLAGVSPETVRRWLREERLPALRPIAAGSSPYRIRLDDLAAFLRTEPDVLMPPPPEFAYTIPRLKGAKSIPAPAEAPSRPPDDDAFIRALLAANADVQGDPYARGDAEYIAPRFIEAADRLDSRAAEVVQSP